MYKYETHLHTSPVSRCAKANVTQTLDFYKSLGYDGVFVTNHFLDSNINIDYDAPFDEKINFYFNDYEEALAYGKIIGIKVFLGVESSYHGTDFLIYGLDKDWYASHPEIFQMRRSKMLEYLRANGAFLVHAHPFRGSDYIDCIRLFQKQTEAVEVINACRTDFENKMADIYASEYGFIKLAGSDNHRASELERLAGVECEEPIECVQDYISFAREGKLKIFCTPQLTDND